MRTLRAILLALVLILGLTAGTLFVIGALEVESTPPRDAHPGDSPPRGQSPSFSLRTILSRLELIPSWRRGKEIVALVIENHEDARPHQLGLEKALLIQEYMVEGLISRFVVLFDVRNLPERVGPVRSLRAYFLDGMQPLARVILHAGGSPDALERAQKEHGMTAVNGLAFDGYFERNEEIAAPHNLFIARAAVRELLPEEMPSTPWPPYLIGTSEELTLGGPQVREIRVNFMNPMHNVVYVYDPWIKWYLRRNGGVESSARPHNVLMLEAPIESIGEFGRLHIPLDGGGRLLLFHSGRVTEGRWHKSGTDSPFEFFGVDGEPLTLVAGQTWMTLLPTLERVSW